MLKAIGNYNDYLQETTDIDFNNPEILRLADILKGQSSDQLDLIEKTYLYVRDQISHSADIQGSYVTCKASEVLKYREGICYAKAHLLAALLRANNIPCGLCYQRLILDDITAPYLIVHGLNAVWLETDRKWIRIDPRGNKPGVEASFSVNEEKLAFKVREELGEADIRIVFYKPDQHVIDKLVFHKDVEALFDDLPKDLAYPWRQYV